MSVLADFIVAFREDALAYDGRAFPETHRLEWRTCTGLEVSTLHVIVSRREFDDAFALMEAAAFESEAMDAVVCQFHPELLEALATASDWDLRRWGAEWSKTDELVHFGDEPAEVVRGLHELAKLAVAEAKCLYLWNAC